jgi:FKBP-type peptidyl-prolyl cis-trans isomerase FkpA
VDNITSLQVSDTKVGTGTAATSGKEVTVHYTGWLYDPKTADHRGKKFDSSRDHGEPFEFTLGDHEVIDGWDEGIKGMRVGGIRQLVIPASMGYGTHGSGENIPPNAALKFEVELMEVN